jgi:hypothetical protein
MINNYSSKPLSFCVLKCSLMIAYVNQAVYMWLSFIPPKLCLTCTVVGCISKYWIDQTEEDKIGGTCSMLIADEKCM